MAIDKMDWHYDSVDEYGLPQESAGTHIGMFLTWVIDNDLLGEEHTEDNTSLEYIKKVKNRKACGRDFLIDMCDERFWEEDLSEIGYEFVRDYYEDLEGIFANKYANYYEDYGKVFENYETIFHTENNWENYSKLEPILDKRYKEWKEYKKGL